MKITASIVTFNSADEIEKLLASLLKCNLEAANIYVVDNGSSDGGNRQRKVCRREHH